MSDTESRWATASQKVIRRLGFILFVLSFISPSGHVPWVPTEREHVNDYLMPFGGLKAFIMAPGLVTFVPLWRGEGIDDGLTWYEIFARSALLIAWLTNFIIFFRLPRMVACLVIALPWIAYVCWYDFMAAFIPFYFWATGIALIHFSRFWRSPSGQAVVPKTGQAIV